MFEVSVYDGLVSEEQHKEVWSYINNQEWYATWKQTRASSGVYVPAQTREHVWFNYQVRPNPTMWMHRAVFGSDDASLQNNHPVVWKLWETINGALGNRFYIGGDPEDMACDPDDPRWQAPATQDPSLEPGWRVYAGGQPDEGIKRSHGVHRDTIRMDETKNYTILFYANPVWYPTWFAENIFYPDDPEGKAKDTQQFQKGHGQSRNFNVGWGDEGKTVSPKPGRVVVYDGRTLHTTRPAALWAHDIRKVIAFRARLKE